jgi:hypothetical protein
MDFLLMNGAKLLNNINSFVDYWTLIRKYNVSIDAEMERHILGRRDCAFLVCSATGKHIKFLVRWFFS